MKERVENILNDAIKNYPSLKGVREDIAKAFEIIKTAFERGNKLMVCGNGGSCSDSLHIVGELMKDFCLKRPIDGKIAENLRKSGVEGEELCTALAGALPTVSLSTESALGSAVINDVNASVVFAQQVYGLGREGDVLLALSTSGNSENCVKAVITAKAKNISALALTGEGGGRLLSLCDVTIRVPQKETYRIQELHLPVYHTLCLMLEEHFFGK